MTKIFVKVLKSAIVLSGNSIFGFLDLFDFLILSLVPSQLTCFGKCILSNSNFVCSCRRWAICCEKGGDSNRGAVRVGETGDTCDVTVQPSKLITFSRPCYNICQGEYVLS